MIGLGATALLAIGVVLVANHLVTRQIDGQDARNSFLESEIRQLDRDIARIEELEETRSRMLSRKEVIEELQEHRSMSVHLFNYMAQTVPDDLRLTTVRQSGSTLTIRGRTQSETRVSEYMRNIESAGWLHDPTLNIVEALERDGPDLPYRFELRARLGSPPATDEEN